MNEKDEAIISILERRARLSSRTLSKMVRLPVSTTHRRVKRLEREGVIKGYKALVDYEKTNRPISALILINLAEVISGIGHIPKKTVLSALRGLGEIEEITEVQAADFDLVIKARLQTLKKLSAFMEEIRAIEGIEEASPVIIVEENILPPT